MKIEKEIKNALIKKLMIINLIITLGLLLSITINVIKEWLQIPVTPILSNMELFRDFTDVLKLASGKANQNATGNYFPLAYVIMCILEFLSFGKYKLMYFLTVIICIITYIIFSTKIIKSEIINKEKKRVYINICILIFMQYPMLFAFQRGNIEFIVLAFCFLFYYLYKKEKYNLAAIALSISICMKLYPALLAFMFINKKKYKSFFLCAGISLILTILSFIVIQNNLGGLTHYLSGFTKFVDVVGKLSGMQYNHSLLFGIYYLLYKVFSISISEIFSSNIINIYTYIIIFISIILVIFTVRKNMSEWKKLTLLTLMIVSFPYISFDYTLILLVIPIMEFIIDRNTQNWEEIVYSILFGLLLIPMNFYEEKLNFVSPNIGLILRPIIIITIMMLIISSNVKIDTKNKKELCSEN